MMLQSHAHPIGRPRSWIHERMVRTNVLMESCAGLVTMRAKVRKHALQKPAPCMATYM